MDIDDYTDEKELVIAKMKLNTKRVEKMISEMDVLLDDIEKSVFKHEDKVYLLTVYKENVDNISRNIKF